MKECFKVGLYRQGLLHDLSKYSPTEFLVGCRYYQGNRSPNNAEREATGYSKAWLHHKGRNKHHYEYWIDYSVDPGEGIIGLKMPLQYVVEMFMDRIAASKTYQGDAYRDSHPLEYYEKGAGRLGKMIHTKVFLIFKYRQFVYGRFENRLYNSNPAATSSATASLLMAATRARPKFMTNPGPLPVITLSETSTASPVTFAPISFGSKPG